MIQSIKFSISRAGYCEEVHLSSARITLGRGLDNDLVIDDQSVSRYHARIETTGDNLVLIDNESANGTFVNGLRVSNSVILGASDTICLPGGHEITFSVKGQTSTLSLISPVPVSLNGVQTSPVLRTSASKRAYRVSLRVVAAVSTIALLIVFVSIYVLALRRPNRPPTSSNRSNSARDSNSLTAVYSKPTETKEPDPTRKAVEADAVQVMRRITNDINQYDFDDSTITAISELVAQYSNSSELNRSMKSIEKDRATLTRKIRDLSNNRIEPDLAIITTLAKTDGGRAGNPVAETINIVGDLDELKKTFDFGSDANGSLLVVAAYKMGRGDKKSHPLLSQMRQLKISGSERNVWSLRKLGALNQQTFDFVLRFLALGVIYVDPARYLHEY